jgi:hypothetical protein
MMDRARGMAVQRRLRSVQDAVCGAEVNFRQGAQELQSCDPLGWHEILSSFAVLEDAIKDAHDSVPFVVWAMENEREEVAV